jgi:hypothetical protein
MLIKAGVSEFYIYERRNIIRRYEKGGIMQPAYLRRRLAFEAPRRRTWPLRQSAQAATNRRKKPSTLRGFFPLRSFAAARLVLQRADICRLLALRAGLHFERYALIFFQRLEPFRANFREVSEEIIATRIRRNEAKALRIVEPFDDTGFHIPDFLDI